MAPKVNYRVTVARTAEECRHLAIMRRRFRPGDRVMRSPGRKGHWYMRVQSGTVIRLMRQWPSLVILFDGNKTTSSYHYTHVRKLPKLPTLPT